VLILVFQTFDRIIYSTLTFPGTRWYVLTVRGPQMVRDQKKFGNHCSSTIGSGVILTQRHMQTAGFWPPPPGI